MLVLLCTVPLLFGGAASWAEDVANDNLVIVIDASGSMDDSMADGTNKMVAAKSALKQMLSGIPEGTNIGLLVFPHGDWVYPLKPRNNEQLIAAIDRIEPGGNTPLGEYMKIGADKLLEQRAAQFGYGTYRLLVVSDGEETEGKGNVERFTPDIMSRGITVDVIGVAMAGDHTLATRVHSYRRADDPASLERAISEVVAEVSASTTTDVAGDDAFAVIAGLPDEAAREIITTLANSGNHPIGQRPASTQDAGSAGETTQPGGDDGFPTWTFVIVMILAAIVLLVLVSNVPSSRY